MRDPQNRADIMRPTIANLRGKIESAYLAFGEFDVVGIVQLPDNVSATKVNTVALMTWTEGIEAMAKAKEAAYTPPQTSPMLDRR